jgi:uncharacterized membrane protein HdeD (DUF308 family)
MLRIFLIIKSVKNETEYINKLKKRIMIQLDKILHFLAGFFIATVTAVLFKRTNDPLIIGLIASLIGGILKEVYDLKIKKSRFDWFDVFATFVGGVAAISILQFL